MKSTLFLGLLFCSCAKTGDSDSGSPNTLPSLEGVRIVPEDVYEDSTVSCEAEGWFDADGDPPLFELEWFVNGAPVSADQTLDGAVFSKGDEIACSLLPLDSVGAGEAREAIVTVLNSLPSGESAEIFPEDLSVHSTLRVEVSGEADTDQDAVTWTTSWKVNDVFQQESPQLSGNLLLRGDVVFASVVPNDGEDNGESLATPTVTIGNALPTVVSVSIYPNPATENDQLSAIVQAHDDDGDSVSSSYIWTVNGQDVWHGATLSSSYFVSGKNVQVSITPFDGFDTGKAAVSDSVLIQ